MNEIAIESESAGAAEFPGSHDDAERCPGCGYPMEVGAWCCDDCNRRYYESQLDFDPRGT